MRSVGIKVFKNKVSEYVRAAERGETVYITDRDRVVAELRAPGEAAGLSVADAALARLIRDGQAIPPRLPPHRPARVPAVATRTQILEELDRDRSDR